MARVRKPAADRRQDIMAATCALVCVKGLAATTTRDVTEKLGVGAGLLNHYFTWTELRAAALERVISADIEAALPDATTSDPRATIERFVAQAFQPSSDPIWRLWIEATDLATSDPSIEAAIRRCGARLRDGIARVLSNGDERAQWRCADPKGAATRIMAVHDGLVGFVLTGQVAVTRSEAGQHLRHAIEAECRGFALR